MRASSAGGVAQSASTNATSSASLRRNVSISTPPLPSFGNSCSTTRSSAAAWARTTSDGVVLAAVEGDEEADVGLREAGPVGPERAVDALLLVVGRDDDVQGHVAASFGPGRVASGLLGGCRPAPPLGGLDGAGSLLM